MRKIIFLDIDGVLNNQPTFIKWATLANQNLIAPDEVSNCVDPACIGNLNRIIEATGAQVVVSSTWRIFLTNDQITKHLTEFGFRGKIIDKTVNLRNSIRGLEIQTWLDWHEHGNFVILDDNADMGWLMPQLVQTNMETGLTFEHADKAIEYLNR